MRAQVVLTPAEAKCFISKAIARMDVVKKAASEGKIVIHPSSTTYFLVKELTGDIPRTNHFVLGGVFAQGLCTEANSTAKHAAAAANEPPPKWMADRFPYKWIIQDGKLTSMVPLGKILEEIGPQDVYVKGCNAVDTKGRAGVLFGHDGGGTIARVMSVQKEKGFSVILAVGLEKLIPYHDPVSVAQIIKVFRCALADPVSQDRIVSGLMQLNLGLQALARDAFQNLIHAPVAALRENAHAIDR